MKVREFLETIDDYNSTKFGYFSIDDIFSMDIENILETEITLTTLNLFELKRKYFIVGFFDEIIDHRNRWNNSTDIDPEWVYIYLKFTLTELRFWKNKVLNS